MKSIVFLCKTNEKQRFLLKSNANQLFFLRKSLKSVVFLYKTNEKRRLFEAKSGKGLENDQKSITYTTFSRRRFITWKHLIKPTENVFFENAKFRYKIPCKNCRLWRLFGPFSQMAMKKFAKSITFIDKSYHHFSISAKRAKPL